MIALVPLILLAQAGPEPARDASVRSSDGVAIRYHVEGAGEPTLVFVHGWSCDRSYWDAQVSHFATQHRVVAIDLAGHGQSGLSRRNYTVPAFAEDVRAVVAGLGLDRVVLVGHSMGGPVIVEAARRMPERVAALVPVDIFFNIDQKLSSADRARFLGTLQHDFPAATRDFVTQGMFTAQSDPGLVKRIADLMSARPARVGISAMRGLWAYDSGAALERLAMPIRAINSDRRKTDLEAARRHAPQFDVAFVHGAGHFLMIEQPEVFNRLLEQALVELVASHATAP